MYYFRKIKLFKIIYPFKLKLIIYLRLQITSRQWFDMVVHGLQ